MLTLQDCIELSDLSEEEIEAIAEHEHVPEIIAVELGQYLLKTEEGVPVIKRIILDDIRDAELRKDFAHVERLRAVLRHFIATHPDLSMVSWASTES